MLFCQAAWSQWCSISRWMAIVKGLKPMEQGAYPLGVSTNPQGGGFVFLGKHSHRKRGKSHLVPPSLISFHWLRRSSLVNSWTWRDKLGALSFWGSRGGGRGQNVVKGFGDGWGVLWTLKGCRGTIECIVNHGDTMQIAQFKGEICQGFVSNWNGPAYREEKWSTNFAWVSQGWLAKQWRWQVTGSTNIQEDSFHLISFYKGQIGHKWVSANLVTYLGMEQHLIAGIIVCIQKAHKRTFKFSFYRYKLEWIKEKMGFETFSKKRNA